MSSKLKRTFPRVLARMADGVMIRANGREAETLLGLIDKGVRGLRAYDFRGGPPFRLGAYVHDLRRMGLAIRTDREEHAPGFRHAVYVLETSVTVIAVEQAVTGERAAA